MSVSDGETLYVLDGKLVDFFSFMRAAGRAGLTELDGIQWETYYDPSGTMRQCLVGGCLFVTMSPGKPCLN